MADEADESSVKEELHRHKALSTVRDAAKNIVEGEEGVCKECGMYSPRLVQGTCAPCRDDNIRRSRRR